MKYILLFIIAFSVNAHETYITPVQTNDTIINNTTIINSTDVLPYAFSAIQFAPNINALQIGCGIGHIGSKDALACGVAKQICFGNNCGLLNATVGKDGNTEAANIGFTWVFK